MIRRRFVQREPQNAPHAQRIGRPPRDGGSEEPFEVPGQQHPEVAAWRQTRTPNVVGVEPLAERLDVGVEVHCIQDLIQPRVEWVRGASRADLASPPTSRLASEAVGVYPSPLATM